MKLSPMVRAVGTGDTGSSGSRGASPVHVDCKFDTIDSMISIV